ncbi:hypothetical protein FAI40_09725 [Acetobacteraceae bacterium]|nr:hypothetical protein FAI40_09725 [Acetobacteraceae bacterium]
MDYLNHLNIPWDIVSLSVAAVVLGIVLYLFLGKKAGVHIWKNAPDSSVMLSKSKVPPPLPSHAPMPKEPTQYLMPSLGSDGAASLARLSEKDPKLSFESLLKDIQKAYTSIMSAYGDRNLEVLLNLLGTSAFKAFKEEIETLPKKKETLICQLKAVESIKLVAIHFPPDLPAESSSIPQKVEVEISSWQVNGVKDSSGHLVFGTQGLTHFSEKWLFEAGDTTIPWRAIAVESV